MKKLFQKKYLILLLSILFLISSFFVTFPFNVGLEIIALASIGIPFFLDQKRILFKEKELSIKAEGFKTLAENLPDGVLIYDPEFTIIDMNKSLERIFMIDKKDWIGKKITPNITRDDANNLFIQTLFPSLASEANQISETEKWPKIVEITIENPQKKFLTFLNRVTDQEGNPSYFIKTISDRTQEWAMAENKIEFVDIAAHQLRTPLTSINWALESIVKQEKENIKEIHETAKEVLMVSERTLRIVNDLLDVAKADKGEMEYTMHKINLPEFLRKTVAAAESLSKERSISIFFNPIPPEWESASANIDEERLGAAISNLIDNAIKYNTKNGEISISLEVFPDTKKTVITIKDTGIGIPEKEFTKIFNKFSRASNAQSVDPNGSGLGLYIVKSIIEHHGGHIGFTSQEGRGTSFWFSLPLL